MQAFDVNAGTFIEHVNSGRLSGQCLAMTFHRLNVYAFHNFSPPLFSKGRLSHVSNRNQPFRDCIHHLVHQSVFV